MRISAFPGRYVQGPGALGQLRREVGRHCRRAVAFIDEGIADKLAGQIIGSSEDGALIELRPVKPKCTDKAIVAACEEIAAASAEMVVGVGGGKTIDLARAAADRSCLRFVSVPTVAATDAPTSALSVIYREDGSYDRVMFARSNPVLVLVDSQVIADAPARLFAAGIGDALSTWFEAESCRLSGAVNCLQGQGASVSQVIARRAWDVLREHATQAYRDCSAHRVTPAFEEVLEANVLLSGLGFENCGVAGAHGLHDALTILPQTGAYLHGEKVAFGVQCLMFLRAHPQDEINDVFRLCHAVGLPTTLRGIGIDWQDSAAIDQVARAAAAPGNLCANEPGKPTAREIAVAIRAADAFGRQLH